MRYRGLTPSMPNTLSGYFLPKLGPSCIVGGPLFRQKLLSRVGVDLQRRAKFSRFNCPQTGDKFAEVVRELRHLWNSLNGCFVHVKAAVDFDLKCVNALVGPAEILRYEAAGVGIVARNGIPHLDQAFLAQIDDRGVATRTESVTEYEVATATS